MLSKSVDPDILSATVITPNAWVGVDLDRLEKNISSSKRRLSNNSKICAVVKADAYGLGIENVMPSLMHADVSHVGVTSNAEAMAVRKTGYSKAIMRIRPATPAEAELTVALGIEELVGTLGSASRLSHIAYAAGKTVGIHLSLNSQGLSRDGLELSTELAQATALEIVALPGLKIVGVMTHFADYAPIKMRASLDAFHADIDWLFRHTSLQRDQIMLHAAHSYAFLGLPESHLDLVRIGAALFGCAGEQPDFGHVMSLRTQVAAANQFSKGNSVGYDRTKILDRDSVLASIPLGYSNGFRRTFSNRGEVLIRGQRAPIVGKISMNSIMADVTDITNAAAGDEVVLFGTQATQEITQAEIELHSGTILAENYTNWGLANARRLYRSGQLLA